MIIRLFIVTLCAAALLVSGCTGTDTERSDSPQPDPQPPHICLVPVLDPEFTDVDTTNLGGETIDERFSLDNSLRRADQISDALTSFRQLTAACADKLPADTLADIGNTSWEIQHLGFHNWQQAVHGTLLKQDYQIKRLELQIVMWKHEAGDSTEQELAEKEAAYQSALAALRQFIDDFTVAD